MQSAKFSLAVCVCLFLLLACGGGGGGGGNNSSPTPPPITADTQAPTVPANLAGSANSPIEIALSWDASSDAGGGSVAGYRVYRDGVQAGTTTNTSYNDTDLTPVTSYAYTVSAYDNAEPANESNPSSPALEVATLATLEPTWSLTEASPAQVGLSQTEVDAVLEHVFTDQAVQAALLVKDGYAVGQRFSSGVDATTLGTSWSMAKSFYAAAIGIAISEGWISSLDQPASDFLTEWADTDKASITLRDILEMRAGFAGSSSIFFEANQTQFALNFPKANPEGINFVYSNTTSQLLEPLLLRATGLDAHTYLQEKILTPIGIDINLIGLWRDPADANPLTYMGIDATPFDMARFGLLFARAGEWDGQQIVPAEFVTNSLSAQSDYYGLHWWILNSAFFGQPPPITIAAALGLDGQKIYVWQDQDLVLIVLTKYVHSANQGYVLSDTNYPNTCTARNTCPTSTGDEVASFDQLQLMTLLQALVE